MITVVCMLEELLDVDDFWWSVAHRAETIARYAHDEQKDKAGRPYIEHPERVAEAVRPYGNVYVAVAWLHDVVEDTKWSLQTLANAGLPSEVLAAVDALTRRPGERYEDSLRRACDNPIARMVKLADNYDNADEARLKILHPEVAHRLRIKYAKARNTLLCAQTFDAS